MDTFIKQLYLISIFVLAFFIKQNNALLNCSMVNFSKTAITVVSSHMSMDKSDPSYFKNPRDVFVDKNNAIYTLDGYNDRIQLWLPNATTGITIINGSFGTELDQFQEIEKMHVDSNGNIYILDSDNHRVTKWSPGATVGSIVAGGNGRGENLNQLSKPGGMFIGTDTSIIWIADTWNSRIVKWSSPSNSTVVCGGTAGSGDADLSFPRGLFVDENDQNTIYIADTNNCRIQQWIPGATTGKTVAGQTGVFGDALNQLSYPRAIILDTNKNMFILDAANYRVMRWTIGSSSGETIGGDSIYDSLLTRLTTPYGITFGPDGSLYVADYSNDRIQKFSAFCSDAATETSTALTSSSTTTIQSTTSNVATPVGLNMIGFFYQNLLSMLFFIMIIHNI